jgi:hypothetical protein
MLAKIFLFREILKSFYETRDFQFPSSNDFSVEEQPLSIQFRIEKFPFFFKWPFELSIEQMN